MSSPWRFALVGLVCAAIYNAIVIGLDVWHVHYGVSYLIAFAPVVAIGYALHVHFTFQERASIASLWRYTLGMAANYPISLVLLFIMCDLCGWPVAVAAPTTTVLMYLWNFLTARWAIVRSAATRSADP